MHNFGLELTWHGSLPWGRRQRLEREFEKEASLFPGAEFTVDSDKTIELRSGVLHSRDEVAHFYCIAAAFAKRHHWPIHGRGYTSGGGHIHISPKGKWPTKKAQWIVNDCINRPWISWIFNEPEDDFGAVSPLMPIGAPAVYIKSSRLVELRFFEAPFNLKEQMLHIEFADRWIASIGPTVRRFKPTLKRGYCECFLPCRPQRCNWSEPSFDFSIWSIDRSISEFKELLKQLSLDYKDYKVFVDRNLALKYEYGLT